MAGVGLQLIEEHAREDMQRAVLLARYTGQRQADVLRMAPSTSRTAGSTSCSRRLARSCGCHYMPI